MLLIAFVLVLEHIMADDACFYARWTSSKITVSRYYAHNNQINEGNLTAFRLEFSSPREKHKHSIEGGPVRAVRKACSLLRLATGLLSLICKTNNTENTSLKFNHARQTNTRVCERVFVGFVAASGGINASDKTKNEDVLLSLSILRDGKQRANSEHRRGRSLNTKIFAHPLKPLSLQKSNFPASRQGSPATGFLLFSATSYRQGLPSWQTHAGMDTLNKESGKCQLQ